jgi:hypothetical protein
MPDLCKELLLPSTLLLSFFFFFLIYFNIINRKDLAHINIWLGLFYFFNNPLYGDLEYSCIFWADIRSF